MFKALSAYDHMILYRRLATISKGYFGWVPEFFHDEKYWQVTKGDEVAVILGCTIPIILRKTGRFYRVVGEVYFLGLMDGEAILLVENGDI